MTIAAVEEAIRRVRKQLADYDRENYGWSYNETGTRYVLIDPTIEALGWDIHDMDHCGVEWPMPRHDPKGRADYVLGDKQGKNVIVIEAKRVDVAVCGEPRAFEKKLSVYSRGMSEGVAVLTNGLVWRLYELDSTRRALWNKRTEKVDLREGYSSIKESATLLHAWLSKDKWW